MVTKPLWHACAFASKQKGDVVKRSLNVLIVFFLGLVLVGCASNKVAEPDPVLPFKYVYFGDMTLDSSDPDEHEKNAALRNYLRTHLPWQAAREGLQVVTSKEPRAGLLIVEAKMSVSWGSRALRWISLGGAGEGRASMSLVATHGQTGKVVSSRTRETVRNWGFIFGGSMVNKTENLIDELSDELYDDLYAYKG